MYYYDAGGMPLTAPHSKSPYELSIIVLEAAKNKEAGKNRTWFTLTVEGLNAVLY